MRLYFRLNYNKKKKERNFCTKNVMENICLKIKNKNFVCKWQIHHIDGAITINWEWDKSNITFDCINVTFQHNISKPGSFWALLIYHHSSNAYVFLFSIHNKIIERALFRFLFFFFLSSSSSVRVLRFKHNGSACVILNINWTICMHLFRCQKWLEPFSFYHNTMWDPSVVIESSHVVDFVAKQIMDEEMWNRIKKKKYRCNTTYNVMLTFNRKILITEPSRIESNE